MSQNKRLEKSFTYKESLSLIFILLSIIFVEMLVFDSGPHLALITCIAATVMVASFKKFSWASLENAMVAGVSDGLKAIFILGLIGILISAWMLSGTVPTLFYLGLKLISPNYFLLTSLLLTIFVSCFTGSSLTSVGTVGVALIGIAHGFQIPSGPAAGAIICGACFGDKMSPLSDTTNFAPGIVGLDLFTHIRHLMWTTVPALFFTIIFFFITDHQFETVDQNILGGAVSSLNENFNISLWTLFSPLCVFALAFKRVPPLPSIFIGIITGLVTTGLIQDNWNFTYWFNALQNGLSLKTNSSIVDHIVNRGGIMSMMFSISLVIVAMIFGGLLQKTGVLSSLLDEIKNKLKSQGQLVTSVALSSIGINFLTGEQYLSILLPGQAFKKLFKDRKIAPENLSRTLEDAGTLVNPLVPWGVSGAFFASALDTSVGTYLPFVIFLYLSPLFSITFAYLNIGFSKIR